MVELRKVLALVVSVIGLAQFGVAQRSAVDAGRSYFRLYAVVPIVGAGTAEDPVRPKYIQAASAQSSQSRAGIVGYQFVMGDDGLALVQYVAVNRAAFKELLEDPSIKTFIAGRDKQAEMEAEFRRHKKDFDFVHFGVRMQ